MNMSQAMTEWEKSIDELAVAHRRYLLLAANEHSLEGALFLKAPEGTVGFKEASAYSSQEWKDFAFGLAEAEADFSHKKRVADFRAKAFDAAYLETKIQAEMMKRAL